jgi:hypothetical protein
MLTTSVRFHFKHGGGVNQRFGQESPHCAENFALAASTKPLLRTPFGMLREKRFGFAVIAQNRHSVSPNESPNPHCLNTISGYPDVPGTEKSSWTMTVKSSNLLAAVETTRITGPNCQTATAKLRWVARRIHASSTG